MLFNICNPMLHKLFTDPRYKIEHMSDLQKLADNIGRDGRRLDYMFPMISYVILSDLTIIKIENVNKRPEQ